VRARSRAPGITLPRVFIDLSYSEYELGKIKLESKLFLFLFLGAYKFNVLLTFPKIATSFLHMACAISPSA
jgi:hypothetical protein